MIHYAIAIAALNDLLHHCVFSNAYYKREDSLIMSATVDGRRILAELSERLKVPKLIPYFGVTKWKPDSKVEEVYSEANFPRCGL